MKLYRISEQNAAVERSALLKRMGFITGASVLTGVLVGARSFVAERNAVSLVISLGVVAALISFIIWRALARQRRLIDDAYSSFQITDDGLTLTKIQKNSPDVSLARTEITRLDEYQGKGFRICTDDRIRNIWVPCELDDYEQLKSELSSLSGVSFKSQSRSWLKSYAVIAFFLVLFAVSVVSKDKWIAAGASIVLSAYLIFSFFRHFRNPNLTKQTKRQFIWTALVGVALLVRAIVILR